MKLSLKGIVYRSRFVYFLVDWFKVLCLLIEYKKIILPNFRLKKAADLIEANERVLEVCCGPCKLRKYLPEGCEYMASDLSEEFGEKALAKGIPFTLCDLKKCPELPECDVIVMIISLYHFYQCGDVVINHLKKHAAKIVIVEDISSVAVKSDQENDTFMTKAYRYLVDGDMEATDVLLSTDELRDFLKRHQFEDITEHKPNYVSAVWRR